MKTVSPLLMTFYRLLIKSILAVLLLSSGFLHAQNNTARLSETASAITAIWAAATCSDLVSYNGIDPVISVACKKSYDSTDRADFLNLVFTRGFKLKDEKYYLKRTNGLYLYRFTDSENNDNTVYIKLFFRGADNLWPGRRAAVKLVLLVEDVKSNAELLRWETLGVPVNYSLNPFMVNSTELFKRIRQYRQKVWLALPLEPSSWNPMLEENYLTVDTALDPEKLDQYMKRAFRDASEYDGVHYLGGEAFTGHLYAFRMFLSEVKKRGIRYFVDTSYTGNDELVETASIMSFKAFTEDFDFNKRAPAVVWKEATSEANENGVAVISVKADDVEAFRYILSQIRGNNASQFKFTDIADVEEFAY